MLNCISYFGFLRFYETMERQIEIMKKRILAAVMAAAVAMTMAGCGSTGAATESATAATTEETSAEVAAEGEWMNDPTAYLSGVTVSDYVELPADYAALTVEVEPAAEVTDEEVESQIESQRQAAKELQEVSYRTTVQEGDVVNIDYVGKINGEAFDGGSAEGYNLEIGSGSFIEGFESGLIDQKVGDTVTLELTFPENYSDTTKAGVDATFDVTINSIQEYVVPDLTDEFVAGLGIQDEFGNVVGTVDEFRTYVRNYLIESNESQYTQRLEEAIRVNLMENSTFKKDVPTAMIERLNDSMVQELTNYAMQYGVDLMTLMQLAYGSTEDTYLQDIKNMAAEGVKSNMIFKAVADAENLSLSDEDFQVKLETAVSASGYTSADEVSKEDIEAYRETLDKRSALDFLKSKAVVVAPAAAEGSTDATAATTETEAAQ